MPDVTLKNLTLEQLTAIGDAMLLADDLSLAQGIYRALVRANPRSTSAHSRLGLTLRPNARTSRMLEVIKAVEAISSADVYVGEGIATWLKQPAFAQDPRFLELAEKGTAIAPNVVNWHWNLQTVLWAAQQARSVPGDFVELGVFRGHTTHFLAEYLEFAAWPKRWWLFDTFEGIPADQVDAGWEQINKQAYGDTFSFEEVQDRFAPFPNVQVIKGRVPEIFAETCPDAIAFMHIDLNNSTAEIGALDALYDRLSPGGVIVFDDFGWRSARAQFDAELKWFKSRELAILPLPTGQGLFVKAAAA